MFFNIQNANFDLTDEDKAVLDKVIKETEEVQYKKITEDFEGHPEFEGVDMGSGTDYIEVRFLFLPTGRIIKVNNSDDLLVTALDQA